MENISFCEHILLVIYWIQPTPKLSDMLLKEVYTGYNIFTHTMKKFTSNEISFLFIRIKDKKEQQNFFIN